MQTPKILVTGANGQLGTELVIALCKQYGESSVLASDINDQVTHPCPFIYLDITDRKAIDKAIEENGITEIYHLAALLSSSGERDPLFTWKLNHDGYISILEASRKYKVKKVFFPSSIAVFGPTTPKDNTPQHSPLQATTVYGISKSTGELWSSYYYNRYGLDIRSLRYPGVISYKTLPQGGTTDYAVEIFHAAVHLQHYDCYLAAHTRLPMMYIDDAIRATIELMQAPAENIKTRIAYNLTAVSFTPAELASCILKRISNFSINYLPDKRQAIADSWTNSIDDSYAAKEWHWEAKFDLEKITDIMLDGFRQKIKIFNTI